MARKTKLIIGLAGKMRSGKTSAAKFLCHGFEQAGYDPIRLGFSDYLKNKLSLVTGPLNDDDKCRARPALRGLADFFKYRHGERFFVEQWLKIANEFGERGVNVFIIDDVRYPYEAQFIWDHGGDVVRLKRPETDATNDNHASETSVDEIVADYTVTASELQDLTDQLKAIYL